MIDDISPDTMRILKACAGKNLPECCLGDLVPGMRWSDAKRELIDDLNRQLGTNYNVNHLNNWIAGRVETPKRARAVLQLSFLQYLFDDETAAILNDILSK